MTAILNRSGAHATELHSRVQDPMAAQRGIESNRDYLGKVSRVAGGTRRLRVSVVDFAQAAADRMVQLVRHWGHAAHQGTTVRRPDVVILEIGASDSNGRQRVRQLRADASISHCFIIAVTARADTRRRQQYREAGADLLVPKPMDVAILETLLLLECVRVNRLKPGRSRESAATGASTSPPRPLLAKTERGVGRLLLDCAASAKQAPRMRMSLTGISKESSHAKSH